METNNMYKRGMVSHVKVKAKIDPNRNPDGLENIRYTVEHVCVYRHFKGSDHEGCCGLELHWSTGQLSMLEKPATLKQLSNEIVTASNSAACGIELTVGQEYLIGGAEDYGVLRGALCGLVQEWSTVPNNDRNALKTYKC
ncbi:hypothetical protein TELCIR_13942 [Teladorsagia circumcincta]|uniref:NTR domain-containing protein n=1 Tax=Teladorsagia circumcincta TaxID=45464 RepID=A0A2G9U2D9_TELCI|nr:hypothetical protein TELCIR_13942 [Teladorsagia circumcincta]